MDRLNQLRAGVEAAAGRGSDVTLDISSPPSEAYLSANESSSKYFSLSDSTFDITPIKDVSLASAASTADPDRTMTDPDELISNISPITKKDVMLDSFKIGKQIEAANILSGGVDIFEDNDNSYDGNELVIDDNVDMDDKSSLEKDTQADETESEATLVDTPVDVSSKDPEVVLQIDGKNVDAIDIGNGLYLYRKTGQEELAAVQIITEGNQQSPSFKFLKVRENAEGNLEVYEEFEIEVSKDVPMNETKSSAKNTPHVPIKDISKVRNESSSTKVDQMKDKSLCEKISSTSTSTKGQSAAMEPESKPELNLNGKMMKFNESRKCPVVGSFTPMTFHSTPNKEGKPLTKTMVDLQLHPSRHSDNVKKTIEVHTDSQTKKLASDESKAKFESPAKKNVTDNIKEIASTDKEATVASNKMSQTLEQNDQDKTAVNKEIPKLEKKSTENQNKMKPDAITKTRVDTNIELSKAFNENKQQEQETFPSKTEEDMKMNLEETNKHMNVLKSKESIVAPDKSHDLVSKNLIFASLLGATRVNQILRPNPENIVESSISNNVLDKLNEDKETVSCSGENLFKTNKSNEVLKNQTLKENDQKVDAKPNEMLSPIASSSIDLLSTTKIPQKEETTSKVSSTLVDPAQKSLQPIDIPNDSITDDKTQLLAEKKALGASSISIPKKNVVITLKQQDTDKNEIQFKGTETETIETVKSNQVSKTSEPKIEIKPEKINLTGEQEKESIAKETEPKIVVLSEKSDQPEIKIGPQTVSKVDQLHPISKQNDPITVPVVEKLNLIVPNIEPTGNSTQDTLILVAKPIDQTIASRTGQTYPVTKAQTAIASTAEKTNEIDLQTNKLIPVAKGIEAKSVTKTGELNPAEKKIERKPLLQTERMISIAKANDSKTYSKPEKLNPVGIAKANLTVCASEPKGIPKIYHLNPITKGIELKTVSKTVILNPVPKGIEPRTLKNDKAVTVAQKIPKNKAVIITSNKIFVPSKVESLANQEINIPQVYSESKPTNNNHTAVPFGQWTDANRQEFLNKFKEIKVPASSNSKQIKNSNDLNRIDVLKKIDSQRSNTASAKAQDKSNVKDTVFSSKIAPQPETKIPIKNEGLKVKPKPVDNKDKAEGAPTETVATNVASNVGTSDVIPEPEERREVNVNDLIGKAIVDMLNRPVPMPMTRSPLDEPRQVDRDAHNTLTEVNTEAKNLNIDQEKLNIDQLKLKNDQQTLTTDQQKLKTDQPKENTDQQKLNIDQKIDEDSSGSLDDIEMKMNELHGIPFVERPPHELPKVHKTYSKSSKDKSKGAKKLIPETGKQNLVQDVIDLESDEELIEHEPITGDIDSSKKNVSKFTVPVKTHISEMKSVAKETQKEPVITENDFDKFAGRNSITYEKCLTVKFDGKEPANVVQTVKEKDATKVFPKKEMIRMDTKTKLPQKQTTSQIQASKYPNTKFGTVPEDSNNKNYQSKIHTAYQSALTAKLQMDRPITMIEDKPVKVVFMDTNTEYVPNQLNVQGKELSPAKKATAETTQLNPQTVNSDVTDAAADKDDTKTKTKHQRKQVLNPVEAPELELIQPRDLGLDVSPKKKRKTDDIYMEKSPKNRKSYLLGRAATDDKTALHVVNNPVKETISRAEIVTERTVSAIDNLVKAAELLENQSVQSASPSPDSNSQSTPVKRGRGRPRKNPLPEGTNDSKTSSPSPQKKPRLIDAKPVKTDPISDIESSDEEHIIRENWTMGKINENIVCPICNKLFRSENVVFKHVKHCTGVSPTRSELEKRSPRRRRHSSDKSFDSESEDMDIDDKPKESVKSTPKKCKSKEPVHKTDTVDVIVIEDTPVKDAVSKIENKKENPKICAEQPSKAAEDKQENPIKMAKEKPDREQTLKEIADEKHRSKKFEKVSDEKSAKAKIEQRSSHLVCEFCGKIFRQASYLANHKLQHKKEHLQKLEAKLTAKLQVFSCEICKKVFRKLHHLVQHRIIHNPELPIRTTRKSSSEHSDAVKLKVKEPPASKKNDDTSAGFRCEPCDKSFRKLHHLVEHRETHDGKNRQKTNVQMTVPVQTIEKPPPPPQCDVCKKLFRKLHHLIEHKEQHHVEQVETSSEKSDDKSVQSSLSTRDIIHECSLCYMVFPNEHSHSKHFLFCQQKKKRQSKAKDKPKNEDGTDIVEEITGTEDNIDAEDTLEMVVEEIKDDNEVFRKKSKIADVAENFENKTVSEQPANAEKTDDKQMDVSKNPVPKEEVTEIKSSPAKRDLPNSDDSLDIKEKIKKIGDLVKAELPTKTPAKDKVTPTVTKRQKSIAPLPVLVEDKPDESNDDDEVRYMLNPELFEIDETSEVFMKVRSNKRNSLNIERPISKDLLNRRTSVQHPPKIPRLKAKAVKPKVVPTVSKNVSKTAKLEAASTDSDDSDVKYAFPKTILEETPKEKKTTRKSLADKRKSLSGIAKRKSIGQPNAKPKVNPPVRIIKRRTLDVEHRCDCGQLFNSAALLTRHTSLAHTPPRIRRRRSPPPPPSVSVTGQPHKTTRKSSAKSEASNSNAKPTRKSSVKSDTPDTKKSIKPERSQGKKSSAMPRGITAHRGVPVPERMRKLMMKNAK